MDHTFVQLVCQTGSLGSIIRENAESEAVPATEACECVCNEINNDTEERQLHGPQSQGDEESE